MNHITPIVSIICTTFNQEQYIKETLDGFLIQKVNFPLEIIVHDDASTDKTADIVKEYENKYPDIFICIYQSENQYSKKTVDIWNDITFPKARGKYIALCEGDDYWSDPYKLAKQIDILENNQHFGLCYTKCNIIGSSAIIGEPLKNSSLFVNNTIPTLTTVFKKEIVVQYKRDIPFLGEAWQMSDYPLWLYFFINSKVCFLDECTSSYRVLEESASRSKNGSKRVLFNINSYHIAKFFAVKYSYFEDEKDYIVFQNIWIKYIMLSYLKNGGTQLVKVKAEYSLIKNVTLTNKLIMFLINIVY